MTLSAKWKVVEGFRLSWKEFDGEVIVYHSGTGNAHVLNSVATWVLSSIQTVPKTIKELDQELEDRVFDVSSEIGTAESIVRELSKNFLIEPRTS